MRRGKTRTDTIHAQQRRHFAVQLRQAGASYRTICEAVKQRFGAQLPRDYDTRRAYRDVTITMQALQRETDEAARFVRDLELVRLDELQLAIWPEARAGDLAAIHTVLRLMERRARLLGLHGPLKLARTTPPGQPTLPASPGDEGTAHAEMAALLALHPSRNPSPHPVGCAPSDL